MTTTRSRTEPSSDDRAGGALEQRVARSRLAARYALLERLSPGSERAVFRARDLARGGLVALKVSASSAEAQAPQHEFESLASLRHPHLPRVHAYGRDADAGLDWVALELVRGRELDRALAGVPPARVAALLWQAARTLAFLHVGRGVVHADLKPSNMLVRDEADELVLIDLGLSSRLGEARAGTVRGTLRYAAPSILAGEPPSAASDLYALGASFLESVGGDPRLPPPLARVLARLVERDPDARYPSAARLMEDLRPLVPVETRRRALAETEPAFAGRAAELARALGWLEAHAAGRAEEALVVVSGESGVGRTRFLEEAVRRASLRGIECLPGRVRAGGRAYHALLDALHPLVRSLRHAGREAAARRLEGAVVRLARSGPGADPRASVAASDGGGWLELRDALREAGAERPLLVVLDDVHLADAPTLAFLEAVARAGAPGRAAFLVAAGASASPGAAPRVLADCGAPVGLGRLRADETRALVRSLLPGEAGADEALAVERIVEVAEGHPGFAVSAARAVSLALETGALDVEVVLRDVLPESLAVALDRELDALGAGERRVIDALAVLGQPAGAETVAGLVGRDCGAELSALARSGVLVGQGTGGERTFAVRSEALRAAAARRIAPDELRSLHARAARTLAASATGDARSVAVVEHHLAAGERTLAVARAPEALAVLLGSRDARRVLRIAEALGAGAEGRAERAVVEATGDAHLQLGQNAPAHACYARLLEPAGGEGGPGAAARARLHRKSACALQGLGELERASRHLEQALVGAAGAREERALACELSGIVAYELGDGARAEAWFRRGLSELGNADLPAAAVLWNDLGTLAIARSRYDLARSHHERALVIRESCGDLEGRARSLSNLGTVAQYTGDLDAARARHEEALSVKRGLGNRQSIALSLSNLAILDHWVGRYGSAIARYEEALRIRVAIAHTTGEVRTRANLAEVWMDKGDLGRALEEARRAVVLAEGRGDVCRVEALRALAGVELCLGRLERAETAARRGLVLARSCEARSEQALLESQLTEVAVLRGEAGANAEEAVRLARTVSDPRALATALASSAEASLAAGRVPAAETAAVEALALAQGMSLRALAARAELVLGRSAVAGRRTEDAARRLHRVQEVASALATPELEWRACAALAEFHAAEGRDQRSLLWLERCIGVFRGVLARLGAGDLRSAYLDSPKRASVLTILERRLAGDCEPPPPAVG